MVRNGRKNQPLIKLDDVLCAAKKHAVGLDACRLDCSHAEDFICKLAAMQTLAASNSPEEKKTFRVCLDPNHDDGITDAGLRFHFRMDHDALACPVELLQGHEVFQSSGTSGGPDALPCVHCLLTLLQHMGSDGNEASSKGIANFFGVAHGALNRNRAIALCCGLCCCLKIEPTSGLAQRGEKQFLVALRRNTCFPTVLV